MIHKHTNLELEARILQFYELRTHSISEIASELGVSAPTVYNRLKRLGKDTNGVIPKRYRGPGKASVSEEERQRILRLHSEGCYLTDIALEIDRTISVVRRIARELGIIPSNCKPIPKGTRFGSLVISGPAEPKLNRNGWGTARSKVKCDCGAEKIFTNTTLRVSGATSCGCKMHKKNLDSFWIRIKCAVESNAKGKKGLYALSLTNVKYLGSLNCYYCGSPPANKMRGRKSGRSTAQTVHVYTGIDKVDPSKGYVAGNVAMFAIEPSPIWTSESSFDGYVVLASAIHLSR